jgi:hypothetical protein
VLRVPAKEKFSRRTMNTGSEKENCVSNFKRCSNCLKVPKHENFDIVFFTLIDPVWVCDLGTEAKNGFV